MQLYHSQKYANVGPRLIAGLIDGLLLSVPMMAGIYWLFSQTTISSLVATFFYFLAYIFIPMTFIRIIYHVVGIAQWGTTIGKAVVGLEVLDNKEEKLSYERAFMREIVTKSVSVTLLGVGFWAAAFNKDHQAWHDEFVGSFVYHRENRTLLGVMAVFGLLALYFMIGVNLFQAVSQSPLLQEIYSLLPQNFNAWTCVVQMI